MRIKPTSIPGRLVLELSRRDTSLLAEASGDLLPKPKCLQLSRILVPVDFSDCSKKALRYAVAFARQFRASLSLLYVVQVNFTGGECGPIDITPIERELRQQGEQRLAELLESETDPEIPVEIAVRTGHPAQQIVAAAKQSEIDLIIMSTHGYTGLKHMLLGSTSESVVRSAPCPVLVVREHEHEFVTN